MSETPTCLADGCETPAEWAAEFHPCHPPEGVCVTIGLPFYTCPTHLRQAQVDLLTYAVPWDQVDSFFRKQDLPPPKRGSYEIRWISLAQFQESY